MSTVDPIASILTALDHPVQPRPEFAESLRANLLAQLEAPTRVRARRRFRLDWFLPHAPPRLRLLLAAALLLLLLTGIATATYIGVRAAAGDNGAVTLIGGAGISTIGPDGRLHTVVRCPPTYECGVLQSVDWSTDGRRLAYSINTFAAGSPHAGLHVLDTTTGKDKHILGGELGCLAPFDLDWSPDDTRLVYACAMSGPLEPAPGIYVIEPDGSDRTLLQTGLSGRHSSPSWSPDGARIAFAFGASGRSTIYLFDLAQNRRTLLVAGGSAPAWSPDGNTIAYRVDCGVKLAAPDGRDMTPISGPFRCNAIGVAGVPTWSPDGKKIAIGTRNRGIYVMDADGTDLTRITKESASGATGLGRPSWRPVFRARGEKEAL
jgi:WD40 repeat protein